MGAFDTLRCLYPLPADGADGLDYQTKSLVCFLESYELRADGTLWHEEYDVEDRSDPTATGLAAFAGIWTHVNERWVPEPLTGEVRFHAMGESEWFDWSAYFVDGHLRELHRVGLREVAK